MSGYFTETYLRRDRLANAAPLTNDRGDVSMKCEAYVKNTPNFGDTADEQQIPDDDEELARPGQRLKER